VTCAVNILLGNVLIESVPSLSSLFFFLFNLDASNAADLKFCIKFLKDAVGIRKEDGLRSVELGPRNLY
jgi:hypothetical protein